MPPSAGPIPGVPSNGNGMSPTMPEDAPAVSNGMSSGELPQANLPTLSLDDLPGSMPSAEDFEWAVPTYTVADAAEDHYALETRVESLNVLAYGDAVRRGETDYLRTGKIDRFVDGVSAEETVEVDGLLLERTGRGSTLAAVRSETTVHGRMSVTAAGWKSNPFSGEDSILLGGALTDTWTGGLLIASAMSDDMAIGIGTRLTAPVDMWLNMLTGMEERPGTAAADGIMVDLAGTLFEREYGVGTHESAMAVFSGSVYQTQRLGFWPMMRVAVGVRNLLPGAGGPAAEPSPPSPPPAASGGAGGALVATNMVGGAAGSLRSGDMLPDVMRGADAAEDMQEISNLRHADNTAVQLDELTTAARNVEVEMPNGMGAANDLPPASPPPGMASADDLNVQVLEDTWQSPMSADQLRDAALRPGVDGDDALRRLDDLIAERLVRIDAATPQQIDQLNTLMAQRLEAIAGAAGEAYQAEDLVGYADKGGSSFIGMRRGEAPAVPWPGTPLAAGDEARQAQLYAELDALATIKRALEDSQDPAKALADALAEIEAVHGVPTPDSSAYVQWQALTDAQVYLKGLSDIGAKAEMTTDLDFYMLVRTELVAGRDPRFAVQTAIDGLDEGSDTRRYAESLLEGLNRGGFNFGGKVPEGLDTSALRDQWSELANQLDAAARQLDDGTEEGYERARALRDVSGELSLARMNMMSGYDPRDSFLAMAKQLEGRTFIDGADGAGEASILRAAIVEYASLLDEFTAGATAVSGLDEGLSPTAVAGVGQLLGDAPIDPSPPYPGLPDEFTPGEDLRLTIDPPGYSEVFPGGMPDEIRLLLDTQPEQLGGGVEEGATLGSRLELNVATETTVAPIQPQMDEFGPRWVRVEEGDLANPGTFERVIIVDESRLPVPDNYEVVRIGEDTGAPQTVAVSDDTQAVVDSMPTQTSPEDFDWRRTMDRLDKEYMEYRRGSDWRGALAYEDATGEIKLDLLRGIAELGGDADAVGGENARSMFQAVQELLAQANESDDAVQVQRINEFLEAHDAKFHDLITDLGQRADEFKTAPTLDSHVDAEKLVAWIQAQQEAAMPRVEANDQLASHEVTYYQQMAVAVSEGRNPITDSGDQIAYLHATDRAAQAEIYMEFEKRLLDVIADPEFHKSATVMGDDTYAPVHFLRPELGEGPPAGLGGPRTEVFDPEPGQLGGGAEMTSGDYASNQETINARIADGDFAAAPADQPRGILGNAAEGGGNVDLGTHRVVNQEPTDYTNEAMREWIRGDEGTRAQARLDSTRTQGSTADYMDGAAGARAPAQRLEDEAAKNPYVAARSEAANVMWNDTPVRPPKPANSKRKGVRFGNAEVLEVAIDAEDLRLMKQQKAARRADDAELPWWRGTGVNRATDPLNTDEAVRHVPTPRMAGDKRYRSTWQATRQPGFGRLVDAPGTFPVNAREQMITELMQGKRLDASHIDLLQSGLDNAMEANRVKHREWLKMSTLIRDLRNGGALDGKTLQIMLDIADSAAAAL